MKFGPKIGILIPSTFKKIRAQKLSVAPFQLDFPDFTILSVGSPPGQKRILNIFPTRSPISMKFGQTIRMPNTRLLKKTRSRKLAPVGF